MAQLAASTWGREGNMGIVFPTMVLSTVPMYASCQQQETTLPLDWYYTTSVSDEATWDKNKNYVDEGIYAHVFSDVGCGGVPFYTLWDPYNQVHLFTANENERKSVMSMNGGYIEMGIAGYILQL
ncbi:hypothetical protein EDD18DRAFT_1175584 [Armillaria luteobubalina]|uniref:DUF5648 domain-containing protein n=1 Tax=Armillaria luteobubalina TaxID=153913 RepID=A0AA39Q218_9AGAR|nr:hypothetical protein EDD18DRAFT_1175584 [Armillaria luteobubalina]